MKKINSLFAGLLLTASVFFTQQATAQAPQSMSYQSVLRNSSNVLLAETLVGIRISVLQNSETGTAVYVETQTATTNANGLLSLQIGMGTATTGTFAAINWASGSYFIKTETDPAGGTNYSIIGAQELLSVPYAMYAAKSGDATTMGAIAGSSSANGGTITAGVLSLTPADGSNGGIVTNGTQTIGGAKTFATAPVLSTATASQAVFTDANKNLVSNALTGSGNVVMSTSPTLTGTITAANQTLTGTLGVGTATPAASAQLDVSSTTKGFLPPRMTKGQRNSITNPATGLVVFCTNDYPYDDGELQVYARGVWRNMIGTPAIGAVYQGGIIAYILQPGDIGYDANTPHGLIAATSDQTDYGSGGIRWNNGFNFETGATSPLIGTGLFNTNLIILYQGATETNYAAGLARAYTGGGYNDWYLPSRDELNKIYQNLRIFSGFGIYHWSSTEAGPTAAYVRNLSTGTEYFAQKQDGNYVRAVRSF